MNQNTNKNILISQHSQPNFEPFRIHNPLKYYQKKTFEHKTFIQHYPTKKYLQNNIVSKTTNLNFKNIQKKQSVIIQNQFNNKSLQISKSVIFTQNKNINYFQPGTLDTMAKTVNSNYGQNNPFKSQNSTQNKNIIQDQLNNKNGRLSFQQIIQAKPKQSQMQNKKLNVEQRKSYQSFIKKTNLLTDIQKNQTNYLNIRTTNYFKSQDFHKNTFDKFPKLNKFQNNYKKSQNNSNVMKETHLVKETIKNFHNFPKFLKKQVQISTNASGNSIKKQQKNQSPTFLKRRKTQIQSDQKIGEQKTNILQLSQNKKFKSKISKFQLFSESSHQSIQLQSCSRTSIKQWKLQDFQIGDKIGRGAFGDIFIARVKQNGFLCVLKKMSIKKIKQQKRQQHVIRQLKIQLYLENKHLTKLYGYFNDNDYLYLIIEYLPDGSLSNLKKNKRSSQKQTVSIIKQVCQGLSHMHNLSIIHRDLKPQNIFIHQNYIKLGDFGCSIFSDQLRRTLVSCIQYSSPQQLNKSYYDSKIDLWSLGILTYQLLIGKSPYLNQLINHLHQIQHIDFHNLKFPQTVKISQNAKDFIQKLLKVDPVQRMNIFDALEHNFIKQYQQNSNLQQYSDFQNIFKV